MGNRTIRNDMNIFKREKSKLSKRITGRIILITLLFNLFIITAVGMFSLVMSLVNGEMRADYLIDGMENKLETLLQVVKATTFNNRAELEANLDSPESVFNTLERELHVNRRLVGCFAAFEPNYFESKGRWFEAYAYYTDSAHIEKRQLGSEQHDYFNGVWYKKGLALGKLNDGYLTDPYYDHTVGSSMYCSYVLPVHDSKGRKVGVYGVDLNLDSIYTAINKDEERIKRLGLVENDPDNPHDVNSFFLQIIDSKGKKIAGSEDVDEKILKEILEKDSLQSEKMKINDHTYYVSSRRIKHTDWTLMVAQYWLWVYLDGITLVLILLFFMIVGSIIIYFFMRNSIRHAIKPLGYLSKSAKEVARGNFDTQLPSFKQDDEVTQLRDSFDTMQQSLKRYVDELKKSTTAKASIESELNVAQSIQMSMLPKTYPPYPDRHDIEIYGSLTPAKGVGGDLYDFFIRNEKLFFCIGDVSGKGVPASLVMAVTRTLFRNIATHIAEPSHIVETMNMSISEGNDNNMFVTLFVGVLDLATGHLRYCNAGHDAPYIQTELLPCDANLPVGVMQEWSFSDQETTLKSNTMIFLYTDGLTEAENSSQAQFGEERVTDVIKTHLNDTCSPQKLIEDMTEAVHQFVCGTEQSDDLTMMAIKYRQDK